MARLGRRPVVFLASLLLLVGCASDATESEAVADESIPTTTQDPADPFERIAGGVVLMDAEGFLQLCFRLIDQDGEVLCADARATYGADEYVSFDGFLVGMEELNGLTISSEPAWLYGAELDDGLHLELRTVGQGEIIQ